MTKILWRGKDEKTGKKELKKSVLPADPNAVLEQDGDTWIIKGNAIVGSKPITIKKQ